MKIFFKPTSRKIFITVLILLLFLIINLIGNLTVFPPAIGESTAQLPTSVYIISSFKDIILLPLLPIRNFITSIITDKYGVGIRLINLLYFLYSVIYLVYLYILSCLIVLLYDKIKNIHSSGIK